MDHKQFTTDDLQDQSPHSSQAFQADRFFKKTALLSIPDTIPENSSAELSGVSAKMEATKVVMEVFSDEDKENIISSQSVSSNEPLSTSTIMPIDYSYIKQCERKLLENSNSEDDKCIESKQIVNKQLFGVAGMSVHLNDTISTPPSALRKEISLLRNELTEAHEFHDFEIQLLKEEKLRNEDGACNCSEIMSKLTEKYSALMELYTNLKTEYDEYRTEQEQMRQEIQSKTADCLETLCSQIEASDNSLNFSSASFVSFNAGIRSSTMMEDITEVEATILQDATVLANDPLSITNDGVFKTPMQTPLKSAKKLFHPESTGKPVVREVKEILSNREPIDSEYKMQLLNVEAALCEKVKEMEDLQQRLFKLEDLSSVLQSELERIAMQNNTLKESLSKKTDQLNELTEKLFTETISLNPSLRDSLVDIPGTKLLFLFIETIMESCRKIQEEEITKHNSEKSKWETKSETDAMTIENLQIQLSSNLIEIDHLKKKLSNAENTISTRDEEIRMLQSHASNYRQTRDDFESARETLLELESKLTLAEAEKTAAENRNRELEDIVIGLKREIDTNKNKLEEENSKMKNDLESQKVLKSELMTVKEKLTSAEEVVEKLKSQLESLETEKSKLENRCIQFEKFQTENEDLKQQVFENEKISEELKSQLEAIESKKQDSENRCMELNNIRGELKSQLESITSEKLELENRCSELGKIRIENDVLQKQIFELKAQLESISLEKFKLENGYEELENIRIQNESLKVQIVESEKTSEGLKLQLESEKLELERSSAELEKLQMENNNFRQQILEIGKTSEEFKSQLESMQSELENRCKELEETRIENESLKARVFESEKKSEALKSQLESVQSEKSELENRYKELENIRIEHENLKLRIVESEKTSEGLKSQLESMRSESKNCYEELEKIRIENDSLQKQIFESEKTSEELRSQLESSESEKLELENRCSELEKIQLENNLKQQILEVGETSEKFKSQLESMQSELENRCKELEETRIENESLKLRVFESEKKLEALISELESIQSEKSELEKSYKELENTKIENENLKLRIFDSEKTLEGLKSQLESMRSESKNCYEELEKIRIENDTLQKQIFESEKTSEKLKSQLESSESEKLELENRFSELEKIQIENNNLRQQIFEIGKTSEELKSQLQSTQSELETRYEELESIRIENKSLELRVFESEKASEGLKSQLESFESKKLDLENRCTDLEKIQMENNKLIVKISELGKALEELKSQSESTLYELKSSCEQLENLRLENDTLNKRIFDNEKTSIELQNIRKELESILSEKSELEKRYAELENTQIENDNLKLQISKIKSQLESITSEKMELENRYEELQNLQFENDKLKEQIFENEKASVELQNIQVELKSQLEELEIKKLEFENRCAELEGVRLENENLKMQIFETEEMIKELKGELEMKIKDEAKNINKIEELKKHNDEVADAAEKTLSKLTEFLSGCEKNTELPSERITNWVENLNFRETKISSVFIETVRKTCEGVENELLRNFDSKKLQWETEKDLLHEQITESKNEKENLLKFQADQEREIKTLQEQLEGLENQQRELIENLKREIETKETELTSAEDEIQQLKSQMKSFEMYKTLEIENNNNIEKMQTENESLKERIFHSDKMMTELKNELESAKQDQKKNILKVEELIREIEELKRENDGFSQAVEETRNLADLLSEDANDSDLPGDKITKLIAKTSTGETKIVSDFVETITKTCKGVQNQMIRKFDSKKLEWETQKDFDLQNLQEQIETLTETNKHLEGVLSQTNVELRAAEEMILELKSQLSTAHIEKAEAVESLKIEIDTKETIIKGLDEMKNLREKENCCLKKQIQESEDLVFCLKKRLTTVEEEVSEKETKMKELLKEIDSVKKEMEFVSQKLEKVEKNNRNLLEILSSAQIQLNLPDLLECENKKILSEKINEFVKTQLEGLETENRNLKIGNENLKEEIKQLTKLIGETELKNANVSNPTSRTKAGKNIDLCVRRLDKLEEINHNLTELLTRVLTMTEFADLEKLKLCSVREYPNVMKKVIAHMNGLLGKMKEMKEENGQLDEECETYANVIKNMKKQEVAVWKENKEKTEALEAEVERVKEEMKRLEKEKADLAGKISKLNEENAKLKSKGEGILHTCTCGNESKKINELKRTILVKEQKLVELQDLESQTSSLKSQIEYLKSALEREKKKVGEEKEKTKKLQNELNEVTKTKKPEDHQVLDELRMRGSISGGIVQEFVDKERMRKLSKDIGILKELCRSRYAEIKRLEAVNAALRNGTPKNSNQMDSPIRSRGYNTRSKNQVKDFWVTEINGKENSAI